MKPFYFRDYKKDAEVASKMMKKHPSYPKDKKEVIDIAEQWLGYYYWLCEFALGRKETMNLIKKIQAK